MRDQFHNLKAAKALTVQAYTGDTDGDTIDLQGFDSCTFVVHVGSVTTADASNTFSFIVQHGDLSDASDMAAVAAADLLGDALVIDATTDENKIGMIGYIGKKRYVRLKADETGTASSTFGASVLLGRPSMAPTGDSGLN